MSVHSFDENRLATYLENQLDGFKGPLSAEKFSGGQSNPTFLLSAESGQYVLRRKPPGKLLKSAHAVDREYAVLCALENTPVPVAKPYCLCEDLSVIGSMFYVMSHEQGRIFWNMALPDLNMEDRAPIYHELVRVLATIHDVDVAEVGLGLYGKPGNFFERQLDRWTKQYRAAETEHFPSMEKLIDWLQKNLPSDAGQTCLIHGDYRLDNMIFHPTKPKAMAVLDWELSTLGHPMADLAYFCMCLRLPAVGSIQGLAGVDRAAVGIPKEEEIISHYCELRNIDKIDHWVFYLAFSFFRLASIAQGVYKRALNGNASHENALQRGARSAATLADLAVTLINEEG